MDDITFCMDDCGVVRCERHPSNIKDRTIPHSYSHFYRSEYCPLEKPKPKFGEQIPVSERLPNENEDALVWVYDRAEVGCYDRMYTGEVMWTFDGFCVYGDELDSVEAWMPLPEPYKGEE